MQECICYRGHPMFRAFRLQSRRGLFRRAEPRRVTKNGLFAQLGDVSKGLQGTSPRQECSLLVDAFSRIRNRTSMLNATSYLKCWSLGGSLPGLRGGVRLGASSLADFYPDLNVITSRDLAYLHSAQSYSDEEYDSSDSGEVFMDMDRWRSRLNRFLASDQEELLSRDAKDVQDFDKLDPLLKSLGFHGQIYTKTMVISKVPLPNYRPDLDAKRPQRQVVISPAVIDRVESLLRKYVLNKKDDSDEEDSREEFLSGSGELREQRYVDEKTQKHLARVEELMNEERLNRRSIRMKNRQRSWQELPEGQKMLTFRETLPAWKERDGLLAAIAENQVLVVSGETGCGKTTQLPQYILESEIAAGRGANCSIICTQPRRISAVSVAERVAAERGEELGESVGYQVRLEGKRSRDTSLLFCTSGILLRRLMKDPELKGVSHVVVDEIHERGMNEDFLLIVLKNLLSRRPDMRLILMSATLNAELFSSFFDGAPMMHIPGFTYPVEPHFLEDILPMIGHVLTPWNQIDDYGEDKQWKIAKQLRGRSRRSLVNTVADSAMAEQDFSDLNYKVRDSFSCWNPESLGFNIIEKLLCHICKKEREGAVLVFLTGWEDISAVLEKLKANPLLGDPNKVLLLGCHGSMATGEQKLIFNHAPPGVRKIVLATNMAETSITINDVVFVVDCGKAKETSYDALNNTPCLLPQWISKASARQRRGRAGRVQPGVAYHLYPKAVHDAFDDYQAPELLRTPLQSLCLQIKSLGLGSVEEFLSKALQPPEQRAVHNAVQLLKTIGALDEREELTDLGRHLSNLPLEPRLGKMLLMGSVFRCLDPVLTIAAGLTTRDPFIMPMDKKDLATTAKLRFGREDSSDHMGLVNAYNGWQRAMYEGTAADYCWSNFLSFQTLQGMLSLRKQFCSLLSDAGFDMDRCSENSEDLDLVRGVICAGLYPGVASAVSKSKSTTFKTKEDGQVNLHQNSVNAQERKLIYPWLVFNEKVKTSSVNIRDSTGVSDTGLLLFGGEVKRGYEPGQLLMQDGFLEFFMPRDVATTILMLRDELDDLVLRRLRDPNMDLNEDASLLLEATVELLRGDDCTGTFVYGRKASVPQAKQTGQQQQQPKGTEGDIKGLLQQLVQKGGKFPPPKYKTKEAARGGFQSTVLVKGKSFLGKPAPNKKQAEKNASSLAIEWFFTNRDGATSKGAEPKQPATKKRSTKADRAEAALEMFTKSKEVANEGSKPTRREKVRLSA
ncbi:unnamed protein product [Calypogeia fissa]